MPTPTFSIRQKLKSIDIVDVLHLQICNYQSGIFHGFCVYKYKNQIYDLDFQKLTTLLTSPKLSADLIIKNSTPIESYNI